MCIRTSHRYYFNYLMFLTLKKHIMLLVGVPLNTVRPWAGWCPWPWWVAEVSSGPLQWSSLTWIISTPGHSSPSESQPTSISHVISCCPLLTPHPGVQRVSLLAAPHTGTLSCLHTLAHGVTSARMPFLSLFSAVKSSYDSSRLRARVYSEWDPPHARPPSP